MKEEFPQVIIPEGVSRISDAIFDNCCSLTNVTIPEIPQYIHYSPDIENSIREKHHLYRRLFKELCRISGEQLTGVGMNEVYKYNLTHEDLLYILKDLKAVYNGDFNMEELTTWIQKKAWSF